MEQTEKTICLNMIVKNESHIIIETLTNLCKYINFSYWVISDTGSTDNTKELIINFFEKKCIPGELVEHEWVDFAYNRTKALECAYNKTDYLLVFDADDSIQGDFKLPKIYDCDSYSLRFGTGFSYFRPLLFTNRKRWRFKGVLHEFLENIDKVSGSRQLDGDYHLISGRSGNRNKNPNKYIDDANILKKAYFEEIDKDYPLACRYAFYCAQSYKDSGEKYENDAVEWYKKCLTLNMWDQEKYHSCLCIGNIYMKQKDYRNALKYWYKTVEYDSERIDGIVYAQNYLRNEGEHLLVNALYHRFKDYKKDLNNKLFLFRNVYNCHLEYNNMISSYYVNDKAIGYLCLKKIIIETRDDYSYFKSAISNVKYYESFLKSDTDENILNLFYAYNKQLQEIYINENTGANMSQEIIELWNKIFERIRHILTKSNNLQTIKKYNNTNNIQIMITFTTCKRLDLFKQTINSILNHWTDKDKIDYWFCVDDNSSETDRTEMKNIYPWIEYYLKTYEEKGHRKSMNIIWNKLNEIKPKYWIHMEDDFLFYYKTNYIERAINGLNQLGESHSVKQILFNRNYTETIDNYSVLGHIKTSVNDIVLHNYCTGDFNYLNCHYWPHYSFRPSLVETKIILELGNFDSPNQFFEMDYAKKWANAGYKSGFFNQITCRHIGRLTRERNNNIVKNAYELNSEKQFFSDEENNTNTNTYENTIINNTNLSIKIINLERRPDRKLNTIKQFTNIGFKEDEYEFVIATDGSTLEPTFKLKELFQGNDFGSRKGVIGCALSHYNLWKQLLNDNTNNCYLIMEDDYILCPDFKNKLQDLIASNVFNIRDTVFLGYHMFSNDRKQNFNIYNNLSNNTTVVPLDKHLYIGGYFAYTINKNGAKKMINYIKNNGIKHGIDYLNKIIPGLDSYECQPQLVFSEWNEDGKKIDSDIQNIYDKIDFSNVICDELSEHFTYIPNMDIIGNDLYFHKKPLKELLQIAHNDPNCVAVNTLGFFKNIFTKLAVSKYFRESDGIYIKKKYYNPKQTIKIKMLCNWTSSLNLCKEWSNMCEDGFTWKNYELVWTDDKSIVDYYVIINFPPKDTYFDPKKTIVFQMEPWVYDPNKNWGVKTWGQWAEPNPKDFLAVRGLKTNHHTNAFWQLELKFNDFQKSELFIKTKGTTISSICSSKYFDEGHILRIDFLKFLETKGDILLDIYSQDNTHHFNNYRGQLPMICKSDGLKQYKYYFMIENNFETNYITEKLWEPILCETLCFYYGCPNVTDYIDPGAFVLLDIHDFKKSYQIIKQAIEEDWWSQRIEIIKKEKAKILNELAFFPTIDKIINCNNSNNNI